MANGIKLTTLTNSIAALSVAGVTIYDIDEIPDQIDPREGMILSPHIDEGFISNLKVMRDSFGAFSDANTKRTIRYRLHYRFYYGQVGADRGPGVLFDDVLAGLVLILDAIVQNQELSGMIDGTPEIGSAVPITDPSGYQYYGRDIFWDITQLYEV